MLDQVLRACRCIWGQAGVEGSGWHHHKSSGSIFGVHGGSWRALGVTMRSSLRLWGEKVFVSREINTFSRASGPPRGGRLQLGGRSNKGAAPSPRLREHVHEDGFGSGAVAGRRLSRQGPPILHSLQRRQREKPDVERDGRGDGTRAGQRKGSADRATV